MRNIRKYKKIRNKRLPKYVPGKNATTSGYESSRFVDNSLLSVTPEADLQPQADALKKSNVTNAITQGLSQAHNIYNLISNAGTSAASAGASAIVPAMSSVGTYTIPGMGNVALNVTTDAVGGAANSAASGSATGAGSAAGSVLGTALPIASIALGGYNAINTIGNYKNYTKSNDMMNASGSATEYANGVAYTKNTGFDSGAVDDITSAQNTGDTISLTGSGMGIGAGIGTLVGGPLGTAIGAGIGALTGLFGGLFGGRSRRRKVEEAKTRVRNRVFASNMQNEANATTKGIENQFYASHGGLATAKEGKNIGQNLSTTDYTNLINTPQGTAYGQISGLMNDKEVHGNILTGQSSTPKPNVPMSMRSGTESIPVGSVDGEQSFQNEDFILSNDKPAAILGTNATFAQLGMKNAETDMQLSKMKEYVQAQTEERNKKASKKVREFNNRRAQKYINQIDQYLQPIRQQQQMLANAQQQQDQIIEDAVYGKQYKCGKNTYSRGLNPAYGAATALPYLLQESSLANSEVPYAQNSFVPNDEARAALKILGGFNYDPSAELSKIDQVAAQNRYAINQAGNLSAGQKAALTANANNQLFMQRAAINADAYNRNAAYRQQYANAMLQSGQSEAARKQQALATQQEAYRQAVGAKQKWQAQARKNWYTVGRQTLQDINSYDMSNELMDLYDYQVTGAKKIKHIKNKNYDAIRKAQNIGVFTPMLATKNNNYLGYGLKDTPISRSIPNFYIPFNKINKQL